MSTETRTDLTTRTAAEIAVKEEPFAGGLAVSELQLAQTKHSLGLLRTMVNDVLKEDVDYGLIPGIPEPSLWDPGAMQIVASFNCRVGPARIISQTFTDALIAVVVEIPLISFQTGQEVTCCVGAASTNEVKHKYRWVHKEDLADWGFTGKDAIEALKTKKNKQGEPYSWRIPNPEPTELLNTIWKIAAKRGRVGAAKLLPGVSSALREKFGIKDGEKKKREPSSDWDIFWSEMNKRGLNQEQVHGYLKVKSVKDWVASGKTLENAIHEIDHFLALENEMKTPGQTNTTQKPPAQVKQPSGPVSRIKPRSEWEKFEKRMIPDYATLEKVFYSLTPYSAVRMYNELGVSSSRELNINPWDAFLSLMDIFVPKDNPG